MSLKHNNITLCLTGAISAYKGLELTRLLVKEGATVRPVMTESAEKFVSALSLSVLAQNKVFTNVFKAGGEETEEGYVSHIDLAGSADLVVVAPATANIIGKIAAGIADCPVSLVVMAAAKTTPVIIAPSMNTNMWENKIVQENVEGLRARGFIFVGPEAGELACGTTGLGRLSEPASILEAVIEALTKKDLSGERVLVTAGPTREYLDPVRFLSNASSSMMGYKIAGAAKKRGAEVRLISGPTCLECPRGVVRTKVTSALEMDKAVMSAFPEATLVVAAAAVSDFYPARKNEKKIKKETTPPVLELLRSPDILKKMGEQKRPGQILIGFALETEGLIKNAVKKLEEKNLDMVAANSPAAMESETNEVTIITAGIEGSGANVGDEGVEKLPETTKAEVAELILDRAIRLRKLRPLSL
ncbi:MAG: bifunctional phosphopantothenoylcysteine decarboxylase/phosphopantothenate--cysteine ligase CoaBC [Thermodesulfobacteriota bacterium]